MEPQNVPQEQNKKKRAPFIYSCAAEKRLLKTLYKNHIAAGGDEKVLRFFMQKIKLKLYIEYSKQVTMHKNLYLILAIKSIVINLKII